MLRKYKLFIAIAFLGIFAAKMAISVAPIFFKYMDDEFMVSVIMQLENENSSDDKGKPNAKFVECKLILHDLSFVNLNLNCGVPNSFIEHSRRYIDPYHPSVPTPPPNFC